jgi:glycerophosphoryl diester phosphodiesterase
MKLDAIVRGARERGPVLMTVACAAATIFILSLGPGTLTSHAIAHPAARTVAAAAPAPRIQVIGQRGGSDWGAADTVGAIGKAAAAGVDGVEFDVRMSSDDRPVVFADEYLGKATDCRGAVAHLTAAALTRCRLRSGGTVPTLDAVLARIAPTPTHVYLNVASSTTLAQAHRIMDVVTVHGMADPWRLTVLSSDAQVLAQMRVTGARDLGLVFADAAGWKAPYRVLVVSAAKLDPAAVTDAQRRGHFVIVVEDHPTTLAQVARLHPNAFLADKVRAALRALAAAAAHP